jgi:putative colanic acid biosynthesis acetyltransferase WcaF
MKNQFYSEAYASELSFSDKCLRFVWGVAYFWLFRFSPRPLFFWRAWILKCFGAQIGQDCKVYPSVKIWNPKYLSLGNRVIIGDSVDLYNVDVIEIQSDVTISQYAFLCTASHDIECPQRRLIKKPIGIQKGAWVFAGAFVGMGVTIDEGAVVGARSVVTKNVSAFEVVAGNPAKCIKKRKAEWLKDED